MKNQLLHFPGCPNVDAARAALRQAIAAEGLDVPLEEIDVDDPAVPAWARGWGSPTVLIDGVDVAGGEPSTAQRAAFTRAARPISRRSGHALP